MMEKETSGVSPDRKLPSQIADAAHGGPSPHLQLPAETTLKPSGSLRQYTLQFLIAVIKKRNDLA